MTSGCVLLLLGLGFAIILIDILLYMRKDKKQLHGISEPQQDISESLREMKSIRRGRVKLPWNEIYKQFIEHSAQFNKEGLSQSLEWIVDNNYSFQLIMPHRYFYIIGGHNIVWFWVGTDKRYNAIIKNYRLFVTPLKSNYINYKKYF